MISSRRPFAILWCSVLAGSVVTTIWTSVGCRDITRLPCTDEAGTPIVCPCSADAAPCCFDTTGAQTTCCTDDAGKVLDDDAGNHLACGCSDPLGNAVTCDCTDPGGNPIACSCLDDAGNSICGGCSDDAGNPIACGADGGTDDGAADAPSE
jgi:hypothetical protein